MDPRFTAYAIASHWPYVDAHLELTRQPAVRRALWLLAQLQVDVDGAPVLLGLARLREAGLTRGEAQWLRASLVDLESRRVVSRYLGSGRRPSAWAYRGPLDHWRGFEWRHVGSRAIAKVVTDCARARFCEGRCNFVNGLPDQRGCPTPRIVLPTPAHLFPSGETLPRFGHKVASPFTKLRSYAQFVPEQPVDSLQLRIGLLDSSPSPSLSTYVESSLYLEDRQHRIEILQAAFRAAGGGEIFRGSRRWPDLEELAASINLAQCQAIAQDLAGVNRGREYKLLAPKLLDRARELTQAPAIAFLADVAATC